MKLKPKKYTLWNMLPMLIACAPGAMITSALMNVLIGVIPVLNALSTAWFIDSALKLAAGEIAWQRMILPILSAFAVKAAEFCRFEISHFAMCTISQNLQQAYRPMIVAKAAALKYECIEDGKKWDIISRICENPVRRIELILDGLVYLVQLVVGVIGVLVLIASHVWWAAVVIGVLFVPVVYISLHIGSKNYQEQAQHERQKRRFFNLRSMCLEREYSEERALFGFGEEVSKRYSGEFENAYKFLFGYWKRRETSNAIMSSAFVLVVAGTAVVLAFPAASGIVTAGTLIAIVREVLMLSNRLSGISYCMQMIGSGKAYAADLTEFANLPEQEGALDDVAEDVPEFETLEFKHVTFAYPQTERKILDDFSLRLKKEKHYAFVGVNGAGKTTMIKLITGLYDNYEGEILLNGQDIRTLPQAKLKALCAVVFQDFVRYQVSMRDSIALGDAQREEKIDSVIKAVGLNDAADALSQGLDTPLGKVYEGGQDLSGGQWQRLAIARALVRNSPIRILDEPTAALDPVSESEFYTRFGELSKGTTTIFISHRLGSTKLADKIFVMDGGRIAEEGTQAELLEKSGLYAEMYEAQRSWYE